MFNPEAFTGGELDFAAVVKGGCGCGCSCGGGAGMGGGSGSSVS